MKKARQEAVDLIANIFEDNIPKVLVLGGADTLEAFTTESFEYYWATQMRLDYIIPPAGADTQKVTLTMEQVYEYDPDIIIFEGWTDVENYMMTLLGQDSLQQKIINFLILLWCLMFGVNRVQKHH